MKKIYIHIGVHKTGTTSIQTIFKENREEILNKIGIKFINFPNKETKKLNMKEKLFSLQKDLLSMKDESDVFLVSSESLVGKMSNHYRETKKIAKNIFDIIPKELFSVEIIIFLRKQEFFIESLYKQMIQQGESFSIKKFIDSINLGFDYNWLNLVDYYAGLFGKRNVKICLYPEQNLDNPTSSINVFSEALGYNINQFYKENKNISISPSSLYLMKAVNEYLPENNRRELRSALQSPNFIVNNKFPLFDIELKKKINEYYSKSNEELFKKYLLNKNEDRNYFNFSMDFKEFESEPIEMINVKTILYLNNLEKKLNNLEKKIEYQTILFKNQQKMIDKLSEKGSLSRMIRSLKNKLKRFFNF